MLQIEIAGLFQVPCQFACGRLSHAKYVNMHLNITKVEEI
jgi:hypothetical protein